MNESGLIEFIEALKENRCLWDPNDASYTNRTMRKAAQTALLNIFQKYDPNANLANVRRKIDQLRATYIRERRKVEACENAGMSPNEIYVPTLWYYDSLNFLSEAYKVAKTGAESPDSLGQSFPEDDEEEKQEVREQLGDDATDFRAPPQKVLKRKRNSTPKLLIAANEKVINSKEAGPMDSWGAFGLSVGGDLRYLESKQQTIAQKLISDVIFFAKMGRLSEGSTVVSTSCNLVSSSSSASSIMSTTSPACNANGPLSPYHEVPTTIEPPISDPLKYPLQKNCGAEIKYCFSRQEMSANDSSDNLTTQRQPEHAPLPQDLQESLKNREAKEIIDNNGPYEINN